MNKHLKNLNQICSPGISLIAILMVAVLLLTFSVPGYSQEKEVKLRVYYHVFSFPSKVEKKSNFQVYLEIPYNELTFVKQEDTFKSGYQVDLMLMSDQEPVLDRSWKRNLTLFSYDDTQSKLQYALWTYSDDLNPGNYEMDITVTDLNSMAAIHGKQLVTLKDYNKRGLYVSDIAFLTDLKEEADGKRTLIPSMRNNVNPEDKKFLAYVEVASQKTEGNVDIIYKVMDDITGINAILKQGKVQIVKKGEVEYFSLNMLDFNLSIGRYNLILDISDGAYATQVAKPFTVQWAWIPPFIKNYSLAIKQMIYITTDKEQKALDKLQGSDQIKAFKAFWDSLKTNPTSEESDPMFEYYSRINYATQHFSTYSKWQDGWKTDRGQVYVMYGPPEEIYHNANEANSRPYDTWLYYSPRRMYVFVDQSGMGDYRLQNVGDLDQKYSTWRRLRASLGK